MDRLRVGRRSVLGGVVSAALGSLAGCVWEEGDEADSDPEPTAEFGYGGKPVVHDGADDRQVDEATSGESGDSGDGPENRESGRGGSSALLIGGGGGDEEEERVESTLGVGEQRYGEQGYGGIRLDDA